MSVNNHIEASECVMHEIELGRPTVAQKFNYVANIKVAEFTPFRFQVA